jgi:hypothetical protein
MTGLVQACHPALRRLQKKAAPIRKAEQERQRWRSACQITMKRSMRVFGERCINAGSGGRSEIRTPDPTIKSRLLYQLS